MRHAAKWWMHAMQPTWRSSLPAHRRHRQKNQKLLRRRQHHWRSSCRGAVTLPRSQPSATAPQTSTLLMSRSTSRQATLRHISKDCLCSKCLRSCDMAAVGVACVPDLCVPECAMQETVGACRRLLPDGQQQVADRQCQLEDIIKYAGQVSSRQLSSCQRACQVCPHQHGQRYMTRGRDFGAVLQGAQAFGAGSSP
jgi:hypothetical protein